MLCFPYFLNDHRADPYLSRFAGDSLKVRRNWAFLALVLTPHSRL